MTEISGAALLAICHQLSAIRHPPSAISDPTVFNYPITQLPNSPISWSALTRSARIVEPYSAFFGGLMPKYVIERELPGAGKLTTDQLTGISQTSCGVLRKLGSEIQWVHSYVTDDKIYCIYIAPNEEMIREHARQGGFPANRISQIRTSIDPTTAEA
jgi:hypothetical protein